MRKINDFLFGCALSVVYFICFALAFCYNFVLLVPFISIVIIFAIVLGLFCLPASVLVVAVWIFAMIGRSIIDVYNFFKKRPKS